MRSIHTLFCVATLAGAPLAQVTLDGQAGSYPGTLDLTARGGRVANSAIFLFGATPGPTPLRLIDPRDPRHLDVGLAGVLTVNGVFLPGNFFRVQIPVPDNPSLLDGTIFTQVIEFPGRQFTLDISNPLPIRFAPANKFRDRRTQFLTPRAFFPVLTDGLDRPLMIGGGSGALLAQIATNLTEYYDVVSDSFVAGPPMTAPRSVHSSTRMADGRYLVVGGVDQLNDPRNTAEIFDPRTSTFTAIPTMQTPRMGHSASLLPDGRVLVTGGLTDLNAPNGPLDPINSTTNSTEIYNPTTNSWSVGPRLSRPRAGHMAQPLPDGRILLAGGIGWTRILFKIPQIWSNCEIYDPATGRFVSAPSMRNSRAVGAIVEIAPGRYLFSGGLGSILSLGAPTKTTEIYTYSASGSGSWSSAGSMAIARGMHTAYAIGGNRFLHIGGAAGALTMPQSLDSTEFYDATSGQWSAGPKLSKARSGFGSYVTRSGQVHILGGGSGFTGTVDNLTDWYFR